jgi:PAS domain S-box-containing protein
MSVEQERRTRQFQELDALRPRVCESGESQDRLCEYDEQRRAIGENARDIVLSVDPQGTILCISRTPPPYTPEEVVGTSAYDYLRPDCHVTLRNALQQAIETDGPCRCWLAGARPDGPASWYSVNIWPMKQEGQIAALTLIATDLAAQRQLDPLTREPQLYCPGLLNSIATGVGLATIEGQVLDCSEAMLQIIGCSRAEIGRISLKDICADAEGHSELLEQLRVEGLIRDAEVQLTRTDGGIYWANLNVLPLPFTSRHLLLITLVDITKQKYLEHMCRDVEEKCQSLAQKTGVIAYELDEKGIITLMGPTVEAVLGYRPEQLVGKHFTALIPKKARKRILANLKAVFAKGRLTGQTILLDKGKQPHPVEYESTVIKRSDGHLCVRGTARGISGQIGMQHRMATLSSAFGQSADGVALVGPEFRLLYVNEAFARMHGYRREDMLGMPVAKLSDREQMGGREDRLCQTQQLGLWEGETSHIRKDGTTFGVRVSVAPVQGEQGEPVGILSIARDITESKQAEKELNAYRRKMARMERLASLGTFSAMLAHELTQPLTVLRLSIDNSLRALQATSCTNVEMLVEELQAGLRAVQQVVSVTSQIRDFSRRSPECAIETVDLHAVARNVARLLDRPARQSRIALCLRDMDRLPPVFVSNDIEQVFFALIENTIQAADGKNDHHLTISGAVQNEHIELRFADDCGGIPPEHLAHVFEPFFTTKPVHFGTGLGLAIVQQIVRKNKGQIQVENKLGEGVTFVVNLPMERDGRP